MAKESKITRSVYMTNITIQVFNEATRALEECEYIAYENLMGKSMGDIEARARKVIPPATRFVCVTDVKHSSGTYEMSLSDFVTAATLVGPARVNKSPTDYAVAVSNEPEQG